MDLKTTGTAELLKTFKSIAQELDERKATANEKQSYFDKKLDEIEHQIEVTPMNVYKGYQLAKEFQRIRMLRRVVKRDLLIFNQFDKSGLKWKDVIAFVNNLKKIENKTSKRRAKEQRQWSNYHRLGEITHKDVDDEFNKKYGNLNDQLDKLIEKNLQK